MTCRFFLPLLLLIAGCAHQSAQNTAIRHGGFEWTLPPEFTDDTAYFLQNHQLEPEDTALNQSMGQFVEPLMKFESAPRYRFDGGCALARTRLTPKHSLRFADLRQIIRQVGQNFKNPKLEFKPNRPLSPWRPIERMDVENAKAVKMAGLNGWQETWRIQWARQSGPTQVASLVTMRMADISHPRELAADRVILHMICLTADMDSYVDIASHNVLTVADTLQPTAP